MKIVVCDDDTGDLAEIENLLAEYKRHKPDNDFEVETYTDPALLYARIRRGPLGDIYLLDMLMSGKNGIDLANAIRERDRETVIIYITSSDDYALEAYGVYAARYLLKPVNQEKISEALDYALSRTKAKAEALYLVKTKEGLVPIPYAQIEYIENSSRLLEVHMAGGEVIKSIFIRKSFEDEVKEAENTQGFLRVHKSFLVNLKYVKRLARDNMIMESGKNIPVSQKRAANVKKEYLTFVSEYYRRPGQF